MRAASWELPYPSVRQPVCGDAVVATSQPQAVTAGLTMLERGGNAVDAALAAAIALTVTEPTSNGIGGDAFAIVAEPDGTMHGLNASGRAPAGIDVDRLCGQASIPRHGWDPVTVPGGVSAWAALSARFGRLDLPTVAEPAIRLAREGFPVGPVTAAAWQRAARVLGERDDFAAAFLPGGRAPAPGERVTLPDHARTLERVAASHGDAFYRGELAERIVAHAASGGGALSLEDLEDHEPEWVETLTTTTGPCQVHELPPNGQGLAALVACELLARTDHHDRDADDPTALHWQIEATKHGLADAREHVTDPKDMTVSPESLLDAARLDRAAAELAPDRAGDPGHGTPAAGGTVYLAVSDAEGMAVSFIQSNYEGFGSGVVVPGTGIALHNRGASFATDARFANVVAPRKRPFHTIIPAAATDADGTLRAVFGVMGGPMQAQGHVQLLARSAVAGQSPQAAVDAPRWRVDGGRTVSVEAGVPAETRRALARRGHRVTIDPVPSGFGGAQAVVRLAHGGWVAASDPRKEGHAAAR